MSFFFQIRFLVDIGSTSWNIRTSIMSTFRHVGCFECFMHLMKIKIKLQSSFLSIYKNESIEWLPNGISTINQIFSYQILLSRFRSTAVHVMMTKNQAIYILDIRSLKWIHFIWWIFLHGLNMSMVLKIILLCSFFLYHPSNEKSNNWG